MTDLWMPDVPIAKIAPRLIDATGRFTSPFTGAMRTITRTGDRWGFRLDFANLVGADRARLESLIARMRGAANRVLWSPIDFRLRGSFPATEKLANNNFAGGTASWTPSGGTLTATDRRLRFTFANNAGGTALSQGCPFTANLPHVARYFLADGQGIPLALSAFPSRLQSAGGIVVQVSSVEGLNVVTLVPEGASGTAYIGYYGAGPIPPGQIAGNYMEAVWTSLSQCMLVDGGGNLLKFSDTLASPWTTSAASVAANAVTAADGTTTGATITDTVTNVAHFLSQAGITIPAAAADFMICGEFKAGARSFVWLQLIEATGGTSAVQYFNLSTGALGSPSNGANWANLRAFIMPLGQGWYYCAFVARKTNAAVSLSVNLGPANVDNVQAYAGTPSVAIDSRRVTLWQSSVPTMQVQSAGTAVAAVTQTGNACNVKGLPASIAGLLLPGDWVEINKELKRVTAQLDSDAAGTGYLQFSPPIRTPAADNDPVIVNAPMGRFVLSANEAGWETEPGLSATASIDLIEAP